MLRLEVLEGRAAPADVAPAHVPEWLGYEYTGLPTLIDEAPTALHFDATTVAFNLVSGPAVDVRVDYVGPGTGWGETMLVSLYDASDPFTPVAVDCSAHAVSGAAGSVWVSFGGLQANRLYVVRASWSGQVGGEAQGHFYCA